MEEKKKKSDYTPHKIEYTQKYIREHYKQLSIRLPMEGPVTRETIAEAATGAGESVNAYILEAVKEKMDND